MQQLAVSGATFESILEHTNVTYIQSSPQDKSKINTYMHSLTHTHTHTRSHTYTHTHITLSHRHIAYKWVQSEYVGPEKK